MSVRDLNAEHADTKDRKYAYDFDYRMHDYMLRTFDDRLPKTGRALEMGCFEGGFTKKLAALFPDLTTVEITLHISYGSNEPIGQIVTKIIREAKDWDLVAMREEEN